MRLRLAAHARRLVEAMEVRQHRGVSQLTRQGQVLVMEQIIIRRERVQHQAHMRKRPEQVVWQTMAMRIERALRRRKGAFALGGASLGKTSGAFALTSAEHQGTLSQVLQQ